MADAFQNLRPGDYTPRGFDEERSLAGIMDLTRQMERSRSLDISGFRRSTNVEDNRGDVGFLAYIRALAQQGMYQGEKNMEGIRAAINHPLSFYDPRNFPPETITDPMAIQAGYNNLSPDLPMRPPRSFPEGR